MVLSWESNKAYDLRCCYGTKEGFRMALKACAFRKKRITNFLHHPRTSLWFVPWPVGIIQ